MSAACPRNEKHLPILNYGDYTKFLTNNGSAKYNFEKPRKDKWVGKWIVLQPELLLKQLNEVYPNIEYLYGTILENLPLDKPVDRRTKFRAIMSILNTIATQQTTSMSPEEFWGIIEDSLPKISGSVSPWGSDAFFAV